MKACINTPSRVKRPPPSRQLNSVHIAVDEFQHILPLAAPQTAAKHHDRALVHVPPSTHLPQRDVLPSGQLDDVLLAVDDLEAAVRVHLPDVPRAEPDKACLAVPLQRNQGCGQAGERAGRQARAHDIMILYRMNELSL